MPKMKTHRGAAKRFKQTGSGKIMRRKANLNHILEKKSPDRKRRLGQHHRAHRRRPGPRQAPARPLERPPGRSAAVAAATAFSIPLP